MTAGSGRSSGAKKKPAGATRRHGMPSPLVTAFLAAILLLGLGMTLTGHWILLRPNDDGTAPVAATTTTTTSWLLQRQSVVGSGTDGTIPVPPDPKPEPHFDWGRSKFTDYCYYVEDVCHAAHRFFYYRRKGPSSSPPRRHQPPLILDTMSADEWPPNQRETVYRRYYRFRDFSPTPNGGGPAAQEGEEDFLRQCSWSPVTNHLVLYGTHNVMLGEFYDRTLVHLHLLHEHNPWVRASQLYLHLFKPYQGLMDSHRVFTEPYRSMPLRSFADLWDESKCECMPRLVLCGYSFKVVNDTADIGRYVPRRYRPGPMSGNYDRDNDRDAILDPNNGSVADESTAAVVPPKTVIVAKPASWNNEVEYGMNATVADVRNYLRLQLIGRNLHVRTDVDRYRWWVHDGIYSHKRGSSPTASGTSSDDFLLVGLAQRLGRRRWRNLDDVMKHVQARLVASESQTPTRKRVVLVETNLEEGSSSYQQLVRHGALDGLIGIHGAQLTEAVWMKDGSWVVELLPYIPSYSTWGQWTRTVHRPTPLGEIFRGTELNHAGHRLAIDSSPYCDGNESLRECWTDRYNMWDTRDFVVSADLLERIVTTFFGVPAPPRDAEEKQQQHVAPHGASGPPPATLLCEDWKAHADAGGFVLYNVNCAESIGQEAFPHAYYWPLEGAEPLRESEERGRRPP